LSPVYIVLCVYKHSLLTIISSIKVYIVKWILLNLRVSSHTPHIIFLKGILYHLNEFNFVFPNHLFIWNIKSFLSLCRLCYWLLILWKKSQWKVLITKQFSLKHGSVSDQKKVWGITSSILRFCPSYWVRIQITFYPSHLRSYLKLQNRVLVCRMPETTRGSWSPASLFEELSDCSTESAMY
jgi:hypothetical protein